MLHRPPRPARVRPALAVLAAALAACHAGEAPLFTSLPASETGLDFENRIEETQDLNVFTFRHVYNGGGVGVGDFDGDGRPDLYLTSNLGPNRLFLNRTEPDADRRGGGGPVRGT